MIERERGQLILNLETYQPCAQLAYISSKLSREIAKNINKGNGTNPLIAPES